MSTKVIVTNFGALTAKYGKEGLAKINAAIKRLTAADKAREIDTLVISLDSAADMRKHGGFAISSPTSERDTKVAIDAICKKLKPAYVLILGAPDVVCHVKLTNPVMGVDGDTDENVPSDLPYACDAGFNRNISKFLGPTRVVGRLPDICGGRDASVLVKLLDSAAKHKQRPKSDYMSFLGLSTSTWKSSTTESLENIFGTGSAPLISPPAGHPGINAKVKARSWFINCHGASADPSFYGEDKRGNMPASVESAKIAQKVTADTVAAAECCYGAQLYDVSLSQTAMPICNEALNSGAIGFAGSTNIAYGPAEGNSGADLIAQYFMIRVLDGASMGRAFLQSRHQFIQGNSMSDPVNLKTIGQFLLLGDPSLQPCAGAQKNVATLDQGAAVLRRRTLLASQGKALQQAATFPVRLKSIIAAVRSRPLAVLSRKLGYKIENAAFFKVDGGSAVRSEMKVLKFAENVVAIAKSTGKSGTPQHNISILVARMSGNSVISYREYVSR
jgi:Peptidase family C25